MAKGGWGVSIPDDIAQDPVQSAIWESLAPSGDNNFTKQDVEPLRELCFWHAVFRSAQNAISKGDGRISIFDAVGYKPFKSPDGRSLPMMRKSPALAVLKEASAEIRALSDQLGLSPKSRAEASAPQKRTTEKAQLLQLATSRPAPRRAVGE